MDILDEHLTKEPVETPKKPEIINGHFLCNKCKLIKKVGSEVTSDYWQCGHCNMLVTFYQNIPFKEREKGLGTLPF